MHKKKKLLVCLGLASVALAASVLAQEVENPYFPTKVGTEWEYRDGNETVRVQVVGKEMRDVTKVDEDGGEKTYKVTCAKLQMTNGARTQEEIIGVLGDGIYRFAAAGRDLTPPLQILKLPFRQGSTWEGLAKSEGLILKGAFTCKEEMVAVPAGEFRALHVACPDFDIGTKKMALDFWFAQDVGIVKQRFKTGSFEKVLELKRYKIGK